MLYAMHWEVNENMPEKERLQVAQKLTSSGMFPPKGVNVIRWDVTPDLWGISIMDAESARDVFAAVDMWRASMPGFFKMTKLSPAMPVQEYMPLQGELLKKLAAA
jgi:hypothetical protein